MADNNTLVDMHIHSCASDSTDTPEQIVDKCISKGIGIVSMTDHNCVDNVPSFMETAASASLAAITGTEISCKTGNMVYHILAYGFDPDDARVAIYVDPILAMMKNNNRELIRKMSADYPQLSLEEYDRYTYDRTRGGWESVNYLYDKGLVEAAVDGLTFNTIYNTPLSNCDYPSPEEVICEIKSWGAYSVLAHPNAYFSEKSPRYESLVNLFEKMKEDGIDGIECHYPSHSSFITDVAVEWCKNNDMLITAGCDSHGDFVPGREIGKIRIPLDKLRINPLLEK